MALCAQTRPIRLNIEQRSLSHHGVCGIMGRTQIRQMPREARLSTLGFAPSRILCNELGLNNNLLEKNRKLNGVTKCSSENVGEPNFAADSSSEKKATTLVEALKNGLLNANAYFPYAIVASTALAFAYPPSFTWFTTKYYAPALGFLMFAVGVNLSIDSFRKALDRPGVIALGYAGQFVCKPLLGLLVAFLSVQVLHLPKAVGSGLVLVACVSGAQLANYATFLVEPSMAPLSIVMTALSTISAVVVTPALSLLLLGKRLPVDVPAMMASITQIVLVPIAGGLIINKFLPAVSRAIRPTLPLSSVLVTCACIGAPMSHNIDVLRSQFGLMVLLPVFAFHFLAFIAGYKATEVVFPSEPDLDGLAKTICFTTGMQSGLLGLALANRFFEDPIVGIPSAISTVLMSLMGFGLTIVWRRPKSAV
ncbi:bile acid:Na+ symporter, BASS family [Marchantia polymorpha subsp. ruderalis]|nr:hypothetical protein MARPO_0020s0121 [Marchantia polymorpha]BBN09895.1 hypothetical protein Mp_4g23580 [Marchantia polymorpha subsp. ruderalis]|eukprot:PTQ44472.1 hypothetical protein MARPO_0020s0121 [Marchantia polymorpha]